MTSALDQKALATAREVVEKLRKRAAFHEAIRKMDKNSFCEQTDISLAREAATLIEYLATKQAELQEALAESDRNTEKLEALLDPYISWEGEPSALEKAERERDDAIATVRLLQQQLKFQNDSFANRLSEVTRLAVEALEPLLLEIDAGIDPLDSRHDRANYCRARDHLDRLTDIMGEEVIE